MQDKKPDVPVSDGSNLVIVATPEYVKEAIAEHAASRNHPYATQVEPGFVTLSNETDSDSEITAATSKAVKKAYDLANTANQNALNNNSNLYLEKKQNGADIPDKAAFVNNLGLQNTINQAQNAVPNSRKVNGKPLSNDINLKAQDVGTYSGPEIDTQFGRKNLAALKGDGWWQCGDTGLIIQWGIHHFKPIEENTIILPREFKYAILSIQISDTGPWVVPMVGAGNGTLNSFKAWAARKFVAFNGDEVTLNPKDGINGQYIVIGY
ncbi:tail fiber protein [Xenorhabdus stockiae]|uniref:tail fiber protein n=1 Tax=Xenorhabdus stockiae TaxID=351614 RepID=UPI00406345D3